MKKLKLIIFREYLAKVRNKSFIVMTVLSPLLIVGMVALIVYLAEMNSDEKKNVAVLNESSFFAGDFQTSNTVTFTTLQNLNLQQAIDSAQSDHFYGLLYIPKDSTIEGAADKAEFYTKGAPGIGIVQGLEQKIKLRIKEERLKNFGLSINDIANLNTNYALQTESFSGEKALKGINEIKAFIGGGFGYLIMMFIIIYGSFVMRSVIEEKTSRIIEVIISSVKPFQLMLGKIIGASLAGLTQFLIWIIAATSLSLLVFSVMGVHIDLMNSTANVSPEAMHAFNGALGSQEQVQMYFDEFVNIPWFTLFFSFIIFFTLGYLIYSSIYAAIGAAVDSETDTQQFILPIIMPLMLAIYVGFISVFNNPNGPVAVGFSLFPLTSPIVMMMRLSTGIGGSGVPVWQFITSIVILIITFLGMVWLASKIYRVGILMYGKKPSYKEIIKWLKY
ncbi:ABC transporter permease [Zhouia sp. PK063]|uniref:ABC transporter permease n=1 Tax=Zhouia sp. PK063 TaxID=3373602 RepID=UPI0037A44C89